MPKQETAALFDRAADLIDEFGWAKGVYVDSAGCYCVSGALARAACESLDVDHKDVVFESQLAWGYRSGVRPVWAECMRLINTYLLDACAAISTFGAAAWNDRVATSGEGVSEVLREVASGLRKDSA